MIIIEMQVSIVLVIIISIVISSTQVWLSGATAGFAKDENEDIVDFPPSILRTFDSSIPIGHLRPLGWYTLYEVQYRIFCLSLLKLLSTVSFFKSVFVSFCAVLCKLS